jgi:hypothetical protein
VRGWSGLKQIFNAQKFLRADEGNDTLVGWRFCHYGKLVAALLANPHSGFAALGYEPVKSRVMTLV